MTTPPAASSRATMRDVAALAGVSLKTVSRVINDESGVSQEVRSRVVMAARQLDYRHNLGASNLRRNGGRTGTIAAVVQDVGNSYSAQLLRALEAEARGHETAIVAASHGESSHHEQAIVHSLITRRVDGLVLVPTAMDQGYLASDLRHGLPVVTADRRATGIDVDSVTIDNALGARMATDHLLDQGHRRIAALFNLESIPTARERRRGFCEAFAARGLSADPALIHMGVVTVDAVLALVHALFRSANPPTAIFAGRNVLTDASVRALQLLGYHRDIAVVGFDDFPMADLLDPPVTVIRQNVERIGRTVAELIFARIEGDAREVRHVVLPPTLVTRGSGEIPPRQER